MKNLIILFSLISSITANAQKTKPEILKALDSKASQYSAIAKTIWDYAEVGYQEIKSSALLQKTLADAGFTIQNNVAGMPTAFSFLKTSSSMKFFTGGKFSTGAPRGTVARKTATLAW